MEPKLLQPTFITGYPIEVSPLSRKSDSQPEFAERFELFIGGIEVANGFSELNDPAEQKKRFLQQVECRKAGDEEAHYMDEDYIEALEYGMPRQPARESESTDWPCFSPIPLPSEKSSFFPT